MKLCKLKLKNLNSFRNEVKIDFEKSPLDDASLVAITGPTGAGKTTLLDAICVALYGKTPRLTGSGTQNPKHLVSHGEKEGYAEVYFEINKKRYHATWSVKRTEKRDYPPTKQLFDENEELITTQVSQEVESILGLDFAAFKRSIMLAQGEFAAFLKASSEDRRGILEATAGIYIYDLLKEHLLKKIGELNSAYDEVDRKFDQIPDTSPEQIEKAKVELKILKTEIEKLEEQNQRIDEEKRQETKRKEDFENLQSAEKGLKKLTDQQPMIDELKAELENAERANQLRAEKQSYETAMADHEDAETALKQADNERIDAQTQEETHKVEYNKKKDAFLKTSTNREQKQSVYTEAKSNIRRANEKFSEANNHSESLQSLREQIVSSTNKLSEKNKNKYNLELQITEAQNFINENPLPTDRQQRLVKVSELLTEFNSQHEQLKEKTGTQAEYISEIEELEEKIAEFSKKREKLREEKEELSNSLKQTESQFNKLQEKGTLEDWQSRRQKAIDAQLIAQQFEFTDDRLGGETENLEVLQQRIRTLSEDLDDLQDKISDADQHCNSANAEVEKLEADMQMALLADHVNELREQLKSGEPCPVCGATDHPHADKAEIESKEQVKSIQKSLKKAKSKARNLQTKLQKLENDQIRTQHDKQSTIHEIAEGKELLENLRTDINEIHENWREFYESADISSDWVQEKLTETDSAIENLNTTRETYKNITNKLNSITQELETCERDHERESEQLENTQHRLDRVTDEMEDLKEDIKATEARFWESMPNAFHVVKPNTAVKKFKDRIEKVDSYQSELTTKDNELKIINTNIEHNERELDDLNQRHKDVEDEIKQYQNEGESILKVVREQTNGLETENEINDAIQKLETDLKKKKKAHDDAQKALQDSQQLQTQKITTHKICIDRLEEMKKRLKATTESYLKKLEKAGFESPETHQNAFRDETQLQEINEKIKTHETEEQHLKETISELSPQFKETPFDADTLEQITEKEKEIDEQIQQTREQIGAKQNELKNLKDALKKREELDTELLAAKQELERWQALQRTIPANSLRDFALDITFKQVSVIANAHLEYLTSERYQLKVENIGKLSVLDRWNANEERPVETLSGGESFLTSLALALALSELSRGRSQLNSLFLDEGFGTLDAETLDIAIAALEGLRTQGRSIYLISHIQELTRRLPVKINVRKRGNGSSYVEVRD